MSRTVSLSVVVTIVGIAPRPVLSSGQSDQSPLTPPESNAFARSFEDWSVLQAQRGIEEELGGGSDIPATIGHVSLFPGGIGSGAFEFNIKLRPGTPFVAPAFFIFGERYDDPNVPDDDPDDPIVDFIFEDVEIKVVLDGRVVLAGTGDDLERFQFGPVYFDEPIEYDEPQPRGDSLNSVAALFVRGIGSVYHPLPVGRHTLVVTSRSSVFGDSTITYNITVSPK